MKDELRTKDQLLDELLTLRHKIEQLEKSVPGKQHSLKGQDEENGLLESFLEAGSTVVYRCIPEGDYAATFVSTNVKRQMGYDADEFTSDPGFWADRIHPEDKERIFTSLSNLFEKGYHSYEYRFLHKDGSYRWMLDTMRLVYDDKGNPLDIIGNWLDITERKRIEEALRVSEERWRQLIENIPDLILIVSQNGTIQLLNRTFSGISTQEVVNKSIYTFVLPDYNDALRAALSRVFSTGSHERLEIDGVMTGGKGLVMTEVRIVPVYHDKRITAATCIVTDITEQKKVREELCKTQRLESLGMLAGGIAHDFNNLLGGLFGFIDLARRDTEYKTRAHDYLDNAMNCFSRARDLTQQLLTFSKGGDPVKKVLSIYPVLRGSSKLSLSGSNVRCEINVDPLIQHIEADRNQLNQVFNNILLNARQAMPDGGVVTIEAGNTKLGAGDVKDLPAGQYIRVSVKDQGTGISKELLPKVFDPFFTTKQFGSGLGLATSYSIIKKHGGNIAIESEMGAGTTVTVLLPATEEEMVEEDQAVRIPKGTGRILLMDDERMIREVTGELLRYIGYDVECVKNGEEAVVVYRDAREGGKEFNAVIIDLTVVGGMDGEKTVKKLLEIDPDVKGIVSSGYTNSPVMANPGKYGFVESIAKPFRGEKLAQLLNEVLTEKDS